MTGRPSPSSSPWGLSGPPQEAPLAAPADKLDARTRTSIVFGYPESPISTEIFFSSATRLYSSSAVRTSRSDRLSSISFWRLTTVSAYGSAIAARIERIVSETTSSMSVKPDSVDRPALTSRRTGL